MNKLKKLFYKLLLNTGKPRWHCPKCNKTFRRLGIHWGVCGGEKVDMLDWYCPDCGKSEVVFQGSQIQHEAYMDKEWSL